MHDSLSGSSGNVDDQGRQRGGLKITIIGLNYSPEPSGNAPYTTSLAEGLVALGHDVTVITGYPHYPEWQLKAGYTGWNRRETINDVHVRRLRHHIPRSPGTLARLHMELSFGLRVMFASWNRPDVVLLISPALFSSAMALLRVRARRNRPAIGIWIQDLYSRGVVETGVGSGRLGNVATSLESLILRSTDGVAAIHERFKLHIVNSLRVPASRVEIIRNWTHLPASPTLGVGEMRTKLGWSDKEIIVLHAGNMGKKQGLENVIEAARISESRGSAVRFVLMGDGNQRRSLKTLAHGVSKVSFIDPLPGNEFQLALAAADVLLVNELPGLRDMAVPSKLTSYFNAGVPVVAATDTESVTAFEIETSGAGVRVNADDPLALVEMAEALALDPEKAAFLADNALRYRNETLSKGAAVGKYDSFIKNLASSRGR